MGNKSQASREAQSLVRLDSAYKYVNSRSFRIPSRKFLADLERPVHFLANSVIGPSFYVHTPTKFTWTLVDTHAEIPTDSSFDSGCWTAFRANSYVLPADVDLIQGQFYSASSVILPHMPAQKYSIQQTAHSLCMPQMWTML